MFSRDVCGCFNKRVSVNIGCCGVLRFLSSLVCSVFLIMFPEYILMSCVCVIPYLFQCLYHRWLKVAATCFGLCNGRHEVVQYLV